jgi:hypothetical protein
MSAASPASKDHARSNFEFANALLDPDVPLPNGIGHKDKPAPKRFAVYRNNVVVSLMETLRSAYPSLLAIMGQENFDLVARNFVVAHPPKTPMMQNYGEGFADFLADFKPLAKSPFLEDVARAERYWIEASHAADSSALQAADLQDLPPEKSLELCLNAHPATRILSSPFAVFDLFNARNTWPPSGFVLNNPQAILITRPGFTAMAFGLDPAMAGFFQALLDASPLGEAIGTAMDLQEDFDPAAAITLLIESGAFCPIETNSNFREKI